MFRKNLKPLCLLGLCVLTAPAWSQNAASTQQLVNQGNYWLDQGREDLAADAWRKLLAADPAQPDALLGLGMIDLNQGRRADAQRRLQQLQARHPSAAQTARLRAALAGGGAAAGAGSLQAARGAAAAGRYAEAIKAYDEVFGAGGPPDNLALEYYQVLAGTQDGWARARDGLRRLVSADRDNGAAALALAQVLTYREPSRREGIAQLKTLSQRQDTAGPARAAWRQALLWLNATRADAPLFQAFLEVQPDDREVAARQAQLRDQAVRAEAAPDPNQRLLGEGFRALQAGTLDVAEARFAQVLRAQPKNSEAMGGLGSVRLRQERFGEAAELLRPAASANGKWRSAANAARYWLVLQEARRQPGPEAVAKVREAIALQPKEPTGHVLLGDLLGASDAATAEASYRRALELDAGNAGALQGLGGLLGRLGRADEAAALFDRLTPEQQERAGGAAVLRANLARARAQQAIVSGSLEMAQIELEDAVLQQPRDPWLRLELARLYQQQGRPDQADGLMAGLRAQDEGSPQALFAQALFARERNDWNGAWAALERIPAASRDAEMSALHDTAWVQLQAAQARTLVQGNRVGEAQLLLARTESALGARAAQPAIAAALAGAYADIGSQQRALALAQRLMQGNPGVEERLQYGQVLLRARQDAELAALLRQLGEADLTAPQLKRLQELRSAYVLRQVDALRELGNLEGAYEVLAPVLAQQPQDPQTIAALARLYAAAGDHGQALALYQQQLQLAPGDVDAMVAAAGSAAAMRDLGTAEQYLEQALAQAPQSPEVLAAAGRVYRSAGKNRRAESYFKAAIAAAARGAGQLDNGYPRASTALAGGGRAFNPFAGITRGNTRPVALRADPAPLPASVAALAGNAPLAAAALPVPQIGADGLPAPVLALAAAPVAAAPVPQRAAASAPMAGALPAPAPVRGVIDELRELRADSSSALAAGAAYRSRDGEAGLGQLADLQVPLEARFAVGDGKLQVSVTPTVLDAGRADAAYASSSRFGAGPQLALSGALAADRAPVDDLVGSSLYQTLLTNGATTATRNLIYERALDNGRYQELFNQTDATLTAAERRQATLELLYADPLPDYMLGRDLGNTPIADIARQVLGNSALLRGLSAAEQAQLKALAGGSSASQTPLAFQDTLYAMVANAAGARRLGSQDASGAGVSVGFQQGGFSADVGTTPLGFRESNIVGGLGYRGQIGDTLTWSGEASRRAVTDSLLSFAGVSDPRNGLQWGGVTATGARMAATLDNGLLGGYASLGWHRLQGTHVADNDRQELGAGVYVHALETANQSLTAGLNLTAMQYDRNLSGFTYGHGGYFSPQRYVDVSVPLHWNGRDAAQRLAWQIDASVGVQNFKEDPADYFPLDPAMQQEAYEAASLAALLGLTPRYVAPVYDGQTKTGVSYNLSAAAEWQLSSQLFLGGRMEFNNARDYRQFGTNLYLRFLLDRLGSGLGKQPRPLRSPYAGDE
ncbi:MAG: BCSC C-terminal domain-containing protein [Stenotrophomonas nitritireducens]|uniref:cellulose biosynthesis protein BcsC n=2 Tax=Stenotrophomonas TaxID=40323 RepID=UPI001AD14DC8|nr:cellulose biosynthesis protein BcsC [Stenotrophomonas nitritireducens]MBN8791387.1 BCSC C-terminal domain-containing protein [Stenotrophomonas nitritireducens]MBN8795328.1 BCSC C-terminal domain-containing protein [Stenotrophomonas nitritireducens]